MKAGRCVFVIVFGVLLAFPLFRAAFGKACSKDSDCGNNEACVVPQLVDGSKCQKGVCQCQSCFGRDNDSASCSQLKLVKPCDILCSAVECNATCSPGSRSEVYPPNSHCVPIRGFFSWGAITVGQVQCDECYKAEKGSCVRTSRRVPQPRGASCSRFDHCSCDSTLTCVGTCTCSSEKIWNSTKGRCTNRRYGDPCSKDSDCFNAGPGVGCMSGKCDCSSGYTSVQTSYLHPVTRTVVMRTSCVLQTLKTGLQVGEVCASTSLEDESQNKIVGICGQGNICHACPDNSSSTSQATCRTYKGGSTSPAACSSLPSRNFNASSGEKHKTGQLCASDDECGRNEVCFFDNVIPQCTYGICRCLPCYDLIDADSICLPYVQLAIGASCTGSGSEKYPKGATCNSADVVACGIGYKQNGSSCIDQPPPPGRLISLAPMGGMCKFNSDCQSNLRCNTSAPICDCYGETGKWDSSSGTCVADQLLTGVANGSCFFCPEDDPKSTSCKKLSSGSGNASRSFEQCFSSTEKVSPQCNVTAAQAKCQSDADCGDNQVCSLSEACATKFCTCKPCFAYDSSGRCSSLVNLQLGDACSGTSNEILGDSLSCFGNIAVCSECYTNVSNHCSWSPKSSQPGQSCKVDCDCASNLHCDSATSTCLCPTALGVWNSKDSACLIRNYGDKCSKDADCQSGGKIGRGYTSSSGGKCANGQCNCADGYLSTQIGVIFGGNFSVRQICVLKGAFMNATRGADCAFDPIANADNKQALAVGICNKDFTCSRCPYDDTANDSDFGKCTKVDTSAKTSCQATITTEKHSESSA